MQPPDLRAFKRRTFFLATVLCLFLVAVLVRVGYLQTIEYPKLLHLSQAQYLNTIKIPPKRGRIYDRNGETLALSVDTPSVFANARLVRDAKQTALQLAPVLDMPAAVLEQRLSSGKFFIWLKRLVTPEVEKRVEALALPGIEILKEPKRVYPQKEIAAQIVGYVGVDGHGLEGMEQKLDKEIAGKPQEFMAFRDARGEKVLTGELDPEEKSHGADVRLTLDLNIQHAAQDILKTALQNTQAHFAMVVVLDIPTAEVLAMAIEPSFDPNINSTASAEFRRNRILTDVFEPGSTLKPLVVAAALDKEVIKPQSQFFCENGVYKIGRRTIHDVKKSGLINVSQIIAYSSNIGMSKIGALLGAKDLYQSLYGYGFGQKTGIDFLGEVPGMLHPPKTWSPIALANVSFGHGIAVTALQLAAAYRVLATYGMYRTPRLVRWYERADGSVVYPENLGYVPTERRVLKESSASATIDMLRMAVGKEGSGHRAEVAGYAVAGKTGTAQKVTAKGYSQDRYVAVFGGFLPADNPEVAIVVVVDEPQEEHRGSMIAAPLFSQVGKAAMHALHVMPQALGP